jgi:hypothetical protein
MSSMATFYRTWAAPITPVFRAQLAWIYAERPVSDAEAARILRDAVFVGTFSFAPRGRRAQPHIDLFPVGDLTGAAATALRPRLRALLRRAAGRGTVITPPAGALRATGAAPIVSRGIVPAAGALEGPGAPVDLPGGLIARFTLDDGLTFEVSLPAADVVTLGVVMALSHIPDSLLRACQTPGCERVFLGAKNQRYCPAHQLGARRATQRRAQHAFRKRHKRRKKS